MLTKIVRLILFISILLIAFSTKAQLSKTHYIPPLTNADNNSSAPLDQYIYLSTPKGFDVPFKIIPVGQPASSIITGVVSNSNSREISLRTGYGQLFINSTLTSTVSNKGYIIEAEDVIYVSVRMNAGGGAQAGALVSKGLAALGTTFRVGSYTNENPQSNYLNFASVMATEDNTVVTFDDLPAAISILNYSGPLPIKVTLNKGESYVVATNSFTNITNRDGLIGTLITSTKPIVVNCGSANGSFSNGGGRDYGIDQIVGLSKVGKEYIFVKGDGTNAWENVLIVAHSNNTAISINGVATGITINAGEYHLIEGDKYSPGGNMFVQTSEAVFAYQGVGATTSEANQGMFFVPPLNCETRGNLDNIAQIQSIGNITYTGGITIVTKTGATVSINNAPIANYSPIGPTAVLGNPNYVTYKVTGLFNDISVQSNEELYCAYFNYNGAATSGSFYSGFPTAPEINFNATFLTLGICIPNIKLQVANLGNFDSIEWWFDDGTGFKTTGNTSLELIPSVPGKYKLIGKLNCSGLELESNEVAVSICPDDIDNDGIIDNIDIDNDNDGILNCTESLGNQPVNLSNISSGTLPIGTISYTGSVITKGNPASTPILGNSSGTILSSLLGKGGLAESSVNYLLKFNKKINLQVEYITTTSIGNGILNSDEEFIIEVPNNRTITLVDPDDQLLIDTNFDGIYESGITQISSFQIQFKVKNTSLAVGSGTFKFLANGVDSFNFYHKNNSDTASNLAGFIITTTCIGKDTDGDGIEDSLDLDSDNDGIPDRIENGGIAVNLSLKDIDANGLDDVFSLTSAPIDTDKDGVYDFYDIDSDNDGIYDLEESGSNLPDTNKDGIIDGVNSIIGKNGWANSAETTADSNSIGYTLRNLDNDNVFNYIDLDSDGDLCNDVIEAGFSDGNNDGLLGNSTVTVNSKGKVTNASDGYTIPNSNYSTAATIVIIDQPTSQISCNFDTTLFTINSPTSDTFQWQLSTDNGSNWTSISDNTTYSGVSTATLQILNTPLNFNNYLYRVELTKNGNSCGLLSNEVKLTVNPLPVANNVPTIALCDDLNDGDDTNGIVQKFNLESQTASILGTQTASNFTVTYHQSLSDAESGTNSIISPFENLTSPNLQTIYVRVKNNTTGCLNTSTTFNIIVNALPKATAVSNIELCDDLNDGNDTNGIVQSFDLESKTSTILGSQPTSNFGVTYHFSKAAAISGTNALSSPHENKLSPNSQTIFVRVFNKITGCVNPHTSFNVIVKALPIANSVSNLEFCDNASDGSDTNGIVQGINLESQTPLILGTQPSANYTVTYHPSAADAINGTNKITSPYTNNSSPNSQTIYVRIVDKITGCINPHLTFKIIVHPLPVINYKVTLKQCDNDIDGFSYFNLTEVNKEISSNFINEFFTYYNSYADAVSATNEIPDPTIFENKTISADKVWARVESQFGCFRISEIQLYVSTTGIPSTFQREFYVCDDYLDKNGFNSNENNDRDGISSFDFSSVDAEVRSIFPNGQQLILNYYRNEADALAEINQISDISNYRNIGYPTTQNIFVRVDSKVDNDCLGFGSHITLNVEALPVANPVSINRQCDDDFDGFYAFDGSAVHSTVLQGQTNVTVTYFDENNKPLPSPLPNPFVTKSQTIKIRVTNNATNTLTGACFDETTLEFIVDKKPIANKVSIPPVCDDESNDGIVDFNTSTIESTLLGTQTGMEVHYYNQLGVELSSPLPNPYTTTSQTIKAIVYNSINKTCEATTFIDFKINPLPTFNVITPQILCITQPQEPLILSVQLDNPLDTYTYDWRDSNGNLISKDATAAVYKPDIYTVTVINGNNCSRSKTIEVTTSELAKISYNNIVVEDDSENNSIRITNINQLGIGDYEFSLNDQNFGFQDEPYFDYLSAGNYTLYIRDKNGCGVSSIEISVIGFPKFFTPNNDGYNDTWKVLGINKTMYPNAIIYIFNRFGKLIKKINPDDAGWDGYFNGSQLPATDYWYTVELVDYAGGIRLKKGHFSLIRR